MTSISIKVTKKQALFFAGFLVLYQFLTYIANDMIMPGMVSIISDFHGNDADVATSLTAYVLGGASLQILLGPSSDYFGRKRVMLAGAILFAFFTFAIAGTQSMHQFFLARFCQGMGLCFISVVGYAAIQELFEEMEAVRLVALLSNIASFAPFLGPLAGAIFITYFGWRWVFIVIGVLAIIALIGLWRFMPVFPVAHSKSSLVSATLKDYFTLLRSCSFVIASIALGLITVPIVAWIAISPVMLITAGNLTVLEYSLWQLPIFGIGVLGNLYLRKLSYRCNLNTLIFIGLSFCTTGLLLCYLIFLCSNDSFLNLMPGMLIYSFGAGILTAPLNRKILFATSGRLGMSSALISLIGMCLQAAGIEIANAIYHSKENINFGLFCALIGLSCCALTLLSMHRFGQGAIIIPTSAI